jgi:hypothetical protein
MGTIHRLKRNMYNIWCDIRVALFKENIKHNIDYWIQMKQCYRTLNKFELRIRGKRINVHKIIKNSHKIKRLLTKRARMNLRIMPPEEKFKEHWKIQRKIDKLRDKNDQLIAGLRDVIKQIGDTQLYNELLIRGLSIVDVTMKFKGEDILTPEKREQILIRSIMKTRDIYEDEPEILFAQKYLKLSIGYNGWNPMDKDSYIVIETGILYD